jgi:hypothetical protein
VRLAKDQYPIQALAAQDGFDQKCSKTPKEQDLYWAFAALVRSGTALTRNAVKPQKNKTSIGLSLH